MYKLVLLFNFCIVKGFSSPMTDKTLYVIVKQTFDVPELHSNLLSPLMGNAEVRREHKILSDMKYLDSVARTITCKCNSGNYMLVIDDQNIGSMPVIRNDEKNEKKSESNKRDVIYKFIMKWMPYNIENSEEYCLDVNERVYKITNCKDFDYNEMKHFACTAIPNNQIKYSIKCTKINS